MEVEFESLVWKDFLCKLWQTVEQQARIEPKDKEILSKVSESEAQKWQQQRTAEYKTWLQGAASGYLRPLFRSVKKPEQTLVRPFRELPLEMRSHARRKQWAKVWQPKPGNQVAETAARKTLREAAKAQAQQLGPTGLENLGKVIKKMKQKAPGPDGWTCQFLKDLDEAGVQGLKEQMIEWERQGRLPGQLCVTLVTMLAKNDKIERPIGLTHYAYRAWARTRWPLYETWAREFTQNTPWDKAKKGVSSLDVALARIIRHETARARKQCGVTLLLDIEAFYENIQHEKLISQGLQHHFPAVVLNGAMEIYQGPRYIEGEGVLSAPIRCTQGIIAGCPFAPGLSKLMIHPIIQPMWNKKGIRHIDVWLDDIGIDVEARNPLHAAKRGQEVFREVKTRLQGEGLTLSIKKTVFVVTDGKTRKAMNTIREKDEPEVRFQAKDLGVDTSGGGLRRIATAKGRQSKAQKRKIKLDGLQVGKPGAQIRVFKGSIMSTGLYGHQAMGIAPKRMKWYRHAMAGLLGRQSLGGTDVVLDMQAKEGDPACTIIGQHFATLGKLVASWPVEHKDHLEAAWATTWETLKQKQYPWKTAAGPLGAAAAYLLSLGWQAPSLKNWKQTSGQVKPWNFTQVEDRYAILQAMQAQIIQDRKRRIAKSYQCPELEQGIDWYGAKLSIKGTGMQKPCQTLWQGALRAGKDAWCARCEKPCSYKHLMWECDWWADNLQEPSNFPELRAKYPGEALWTFGLNPQPVPRCPAQENLLWEGDWEAVRMAPHEYKWGTDGTAGAGKDPRMQHHVWGVVVAKVEASQVIQVASVTGLLLGQQTVFRAEARAILFVAEYQQTKMLDVTTDSQSVCKRLRKQRLCGTSMDLFERFEETQRFIDPFWVNSHMAEQEFKTKFGEQNHWRRILNALVDEEVGKRANQERKLTLEVGIKARDAVARQINKLLAERVQALLSYDKDQGPLVRWVEKPGKPEPKQRKVANQQSSQPQKAGKPREKVVAGPQFQKEVKLNKRQKLEEALKGGQAAKNHEWQECHRSRDNLTAKCKKCGMYIQQVDKPANFEEKITHPCWSVDCRPPEGRFHPSHKPRNGGVAWVCMGCGVAQNIGGVVPKSLVKPCTPSKRNKESGVFKMAAAAQATSSKGISFFGKAPVFKDHETSNKFLTKPKVGGMKQSKLNFK